MNLPTPTASRPSQPPPSAKEDQQGIILPVQPQDPTKIQAGIRLLLEGFGFSLGAAHLRETPERVAACWQEDLLDGYQSDPASLLAESFPSESGDLILIRSIRFHGLCPHHLLPFFGYAHVAYLPHERIVGFSQIGALVRCLTHRLTLQEVTTRQIAQALLDHLDARGAACVMQASQLCMRLRGCEHHHSDVITSAFLGEMRDHPTYPALLFPQGKQP
jgi:GTP cyclohydrolase I